MTFNHHNKIHSPGFWRGASQENPRKPWKPQKRYNWGLRKTISVLIFVFVVALLGVGVGGSAFLWYFSRDLPQPGQIAERTVAESTKIYDRTGKTLLFDVHGGIKRTAVKLADISSYAKNAALVAEDKNFYQHSGFDLRGILRALFINVVRHGKLQGGSTITQQFIKNAVLSPEKTYTRKIKELVMAYKIEHDFSKDQILEMYFNEIPYGSTSYGIEAAAQTFFAQDAKDVGLAEGALLAALPKAPTYYSPYGSHTDELVGRQRYILDQMAEEKYITRDDAETAKKIDIMKEIRPKRENIIAPHFVMYVRELLAEKYGERAVEQGGLKIITSLDLDKQKIAEKALADNKKLINSFGATNAALISLDVKTGQVLALVGSLDYFDESIDGNVNVVLRPRQPGSSFKPIVYAAGFLRGYTTSTVLYDVDTVFKTDIGKDYGPKNYDGKEHGPVTVRQALAGSLNIPAVKMIYLTGINNVLDLADNLGYTTLRDRSRFGLSLVLGGGEVKLLDHVNAFSVFAREGAFLPTATILRVQDSKGVVLEEWKDPQTKTIFDPQIARQITSILSDNSARAFIFGAQNYLTLPDRPVAAKTGTTNDFRDAWTVGYTPSLATGVWVGNNDNAAMKKSADGSRIAAPIWNEYMQGVLKDEPPQDFVGPDTVMTGKPVLDGQIDGGIALKIDKISGKIATTDTPTNTTIEKRYRTLHDILFYVDKNDPRGPIPANPSSDIQFASWEDGVKKWAAANGITDEVPPSLYDDVHHAEDKPSVKIVAPLNGGEVKTSTFSISVDASSRRGVRRVEIYLDDAALGTLQAEPWNQTVTIPLDIKNGFHSLRARAFDDLENSADAEITVNILR